MAAFQAEFQQIPLILILFGGFVLSALFFIASKLEKIQRSMETLEAIAKKRFFGE
jgi:uncharacterized integral membrane protein